MLAKTIRHPYVYGENSNTSQEVKLQVKFPAKKTLALDTNEQTFNCDGHSQTGNRKKSESRIPSKPKNKRNGKHLKTLFTHRRTLNIYLHKLRFILDFTDKKSRIAFQVQLVNCELQLFKWRKMPFQHFFRFRHKVSPKLCERMQISWQAVTKRARESCQLLLFIVKKFLTRINLSSRVFYFIECKDFLTWEKLEDYSKLEQRLLLVDSP